MGARCNFWGFLHYDDRRLSWWSSCDGPQHNDSRCDTVMINLCLIFYAICKLANSLSVKTFKTQTVHYVFSLRISVSVHVIITQIMAPAMFINFWLVLLFLFASSLVPKFREQKKIERSPGNGQTWYNLAGGVN